MEDGEIEEGMVVEESSHLPAPPHKPEKSPYDMLKESKASVEEIVVKILSIKKENKQKSELREHVTQLLSVPSVTNDAKLTPLKGSSLNHSKQLALISKSILSPVSKGKLPSFKDHFVSSDLDEPTETETENSASTQCYEIAEKSWVDYGIKEFILLLTRKMDTSGMNMKLEAKVKISMEYPLRPPLFTMNLYSSPGESSSENDYYEWHNEVLAMEDEVNLHTLKMVPPDEENYTLSYQVYCLAMLLDYYLDEATPIS